MMASPVTVCNEALLKLGAQTILDFTDDSDRARLCNTLYPSVRDTVFRLHKWSCLQKRASLPKLAAAPAWGFSFQYELPADCIKVNRTGLDEDGLTWRVEGRALLTDESPVSVGYTSRIEDVNSWDPLLREAVTARLAAEMALPVTASGSIADKMWSLAAAKIQEARSMNAQEGTPEPLQSNILVDVRR